MNGEFKVSEKNSLPDNQIFKIVDSISELFCLYTPNLEIVWTNKVAADSLGLKKEDLLGRHCYELWNRSDMPCPDCPVLRSFETGIPQEIEKQTPDGRYWLIRGYPIFNEAGEITNLCELTLDISDRKKVEENLKQSEEKYRAYIDNAPHGVFLCDEHGNYLEVNDAASKITGYSKNELCTMNVTDFILEERKDHGLQHFRQVRETGYSSGDGIYIHKDGSSHWWTVDAVKISENRFLAFTYDITDKKKREMKLQEKTRALEESWNEYKELINGMNDAAWVIDFDGNFVEINDAAVNVLGYPREELLSMGPKDIDPNLKPEEIQTLIRNMQRDKLQLFETVHRTKTGKQIPVEVSSTLVKYHGKSVILSVTRDITERKIAENNIKLAHDSLKELNHTLECKVEERTQQIQQLLRQKIDFIHQLGHDLKNPLGPFVQLLPILKEHVTDEKDRQIIDVLDRNAQYMTNLVKKTIELAKVNCSNTNFTFEETSLLDMVNQSISANQTLFQSHNIVIDNMVASDIMVQADGVYLQEVFTNLFNNAVKYTNGPGKITITADKEGNGYVKISIIDTGIGITSDQMRYVFNEFYKADGSRHDFDSSGLGLPICKRIVETHGGHIWAESKGLGMGSTFYFTLPLC